MNRARASKERWVKVCYVPRPTPSTVTALLATEAVPPVLQTEVDQAAVLSEEPVKSSLRAGMRERALSTPMATLLCVPCPNSVVPCTNWPGEVGVLVASGVPVGVAVGVGVGVFVGVAVGVLVAVPVAVAVGVLVAV